MSRKRKSQTQELLEAIIIQHKITDINEAWKIYRQKYEVDKELDPKTIKQALAADKIKNYVGEI